MTDRNRKMHLDSNYVDSMLDFSSLKSLQMFSLLQATPDTLNELLWNFLPEGLIVWVTPRFECVCVRSSVRPLVRPLGPDILDPF